MLKTGPAFVNSSANFEFNKTSPNTWNGTEQITTETSLTSKTLRALNESSDSFHCLPLEDHLQLLYLSHSHWVELFLKVFIGVNGFSATLSAFFNVLFIITFAKNPGIRKVANYILFALACCDLGVATICQSAYCVMKFAEYTQNVSLFCSSGYVFTIAAWFFATSSFSILTVVTGDRYLAITLHLRYREVVTTRRCIVVLIVVCTICGILGPVCRIHAQSTFALAFVCSVLVGLLILNAYFLIKISLEIRRHSRTIKRDLPATEIDQQMKRGKKSLNNMYYIILAFLICYVPYSISLMFLINKRFTNTQRCIFTATETLVMMNGVLNPIIYCSKCSHIRSAVFGLFTKNTPQDGQREAKLDVRETAC